MTLEFDWLLLNFHILCKGCTIGIYLMLLNVHPFCIGHPLQFQHFLSCHLFCKRVPLRTSLIVFFTPTYFATRAPHHFPPLLQGYPLGIHYIFFYLLTHFARGTPYDLIDLWWIVIFLCKGYPLNFHSFLVNAKSFCKGFPSGFLLWSCKFNLFCKGCPWGFRRCFYMFITLQGAPTRISLTIAEIASILQGTPLRISLDCVGF